MTVSIALTKGRLEKKVGQNRNLLISWLRKS